MTEGAAVEGPSPPADLDDRLRQELGMPFLPTVFTLLAEHEPYLRAATEAFLSRRPEGTREHALQTLRIGAEAAADLVQTPLHAGSAARSIDALVDLYNQVNPPSLLFTLFLLPASSCPFRVMEPPLPEAPSEDDALLADVLACHGGFKVPGFWRELVAGWPEQAAPAWALVRSLPLSRRFASARDAVRSLASDKTAVGGAPMPLAAGCEDAQAREIERILSFYAVVIPTMVVEIECLRHALALAASDPDPAAGTPGR